MNNNDIELVKKARLNAYSPYSNFKVGALLKCRNGKVYMGCNIENNGIQSICAERVAFSKAISDGVLDFESILVVGGPKDEEGTEECLPCGYCRQFMSEFVSKDFKIYTICDGKLKEYKMEEILPYGFKL